MGFDKKTGLFYIILLTITNFSLEVKITQVIAASGVLDKTTQGDYSSFKIKCLVNTSVPPDCFLKFKVKYDGEEQQIDTCKLKSVKAPDENQYAQTEIKCSFLKTTFTNFLETNNILITPIATEGFEFKNFEKVMSSVSAQVESASYNSTEFCKSNNIIFTINTNDIQNPPLALNFNLKLITPESHQLANCIFPSIGNKITCTIDVTDKKIKAGEKISFDEQKISLENGQNLSITKLNNPLTIESECGEQLNHSLYSKYNLIFFILLLIIFL